MEASEVLEEIKAENDLMEKFSKIGLFDIWKDYETRQRTIIAVIVMFATVFSGVAAINAFAVDILESAGLSSLTSSYINVGLCFIAFIASCASIFIIDKFSRRFLLLFTLIGLFACNIGIGILLFIHQKFSSSNIISYLLIIFFSTFLTLFSIGPGPLSFFITAELNDINSRSSAQSWTSVTSMSTRTLLVAGFFPLKTILNSAGAYSLLFLFPVAFSTLYLYFFLPETKNKSQKELSDDLRKRSNRIFK
uniref:Major facilitator superfamily (MFS) profile domain-containing protein n=1 Tax=Panagrolaimus davidi TaxID=227884 RepID=A0A914QBK1_9BILA